MDAKSNFAITTIATAPSPAASGTSLVVAVGDGAIFPATPFNAVVWPAGAAATRSNAEIVRVTNITSDTLTITRTQEGTPARTIVVGDQISDGITVKLFTDIEAAIDVVSNAVSNEISNRTSAVNVVSNAASNALSVGNAASNAASIVSNALSNEISNRTSADNILSQAISVISQQVSVLSQQVSVLSQGISVVSNALSNEISNRGSAINVVSNAASNALSVANVASNAASIVSNALSNEISNRTSADNVLSQAISVISQQVSVLSQQVSVLSQGISVVSNALSNEISNRGSAINVVSNAASNALSVGNAASNAASIVSNALSNEISNRASADNVLSQAISVISQQVSVISQGLSVVSNAASNALSVANAASNAASIVSNALSNEISNRISANNVLSQGISVISQQVSVISQQISILSSKVSVLSATGNIISLQNVDTSTVSAGAPVYAFTSAATFKRANAGAAGTKHVIGLVFDPAITISATGLVQTGGEVTLTTAQWDSITGQTGGLTIGSTYYLDITAGLLNATAPATGAVRPVGIAVSTTVMQLMLSDVDDLTSALNLVSNTASNAVSIANAASNAASIVSNALSNEISNRGSAINVVSNAASNALSVGNAASNAASIVSNALSNEISNRTSADNVLSQAISVISQQVSVLSQQVSVLSQGISVVSNALSNEISNRGSAINVVSNAASNALSVGNAASNAASIVSNALSNEISNRTSADNVLSQAISVISQQVSVISQQVSVLSQQVSVLSQGISVVSNALSNEISNRTSADNVLSQAISVISQQVSVLSQQVSVLSALGHIISLQNVDASAVSAGAPVYAFTSAFTFKQANTSVAASKHVVGLVMDAAIAISAVGRIQTGGQITLTTTQWDGVTGQSGGLTIGSTYYADVVTGKLTTVSTKRPVGVALSTTVMQLMLSEVDIGAGGAGSVTSAQRDVVSNALSNEISNRISANNVLSQSISVISQQVSVLSQGISVVSNALSNEISNRTSADNVVSAQAASALSDAKSQGTSTATLLSNAISLLVCAPTAETARAPITRRVLPNDVTVSAAAMTNVSGLSVSVTANGVYKLEIMMNIDRGTAATVYGYGLTFPAMKVVRGTAYTNQSVTNTPIATASVLPELIGFDGDSASGSILLSTISMAILSVFVHIKGLMVASATGVVQAQVKAAATTGAALIRAGSFIEVYRIG